MLMRYFQYIDSLRVARWWIVVSGLIVFAPAQAFDTATHAAMTSDAVAASQITRDPNASVTLKRP
jgi:hypothetical protein